MTEPAILVTALMAGLLGSGHCFGMCGGIAAGLGAAHPGSTGAARFLPALQFNLARIASYTLLGALSALLLGGLAGLMALGPVLRMLTAVMIALIGLRFLLDFRGLEFIERGGAALWRRVRPLAGRTHSLSGSAGRLALGLLWGLLPCGLVYSLLVTAASTGDMRSGATVMLAFGFGTLPSMLGMSALSPALAGFLQDRTVRRIVGFSMLVLAAWTARLALGVHHHG